MLFDIHVGNLKKCNIGYLVVVGVETLDDVEADDDVETELDVDTLKAKRKIVNVKRSDGLFSCLFFNLVLS